MTIILAIDPGPEQSAWVVYDTEQERPLDFGKDRNDQVLRLVSDGTCAYRSDRDVPEPVDLAVEMIASYGMAVGREVFDTCVWIGRFVETWRRSRDESAPPRLVFRRDVKLHLCGQTKAKDANIRAALLDKFGPGREKAQGTKKQPGPLYGVSADVWSALAVAVTVAARAS